MADGARLPDASPLRRYAGEPPPGGGEGPSPAAMACRQLLREFRAIRSAKPDRPRRPYRTRAPELTDRELPEVEHDRVEPGDLGRARADCRSHFRGVYWDRCAAAWRARVYAFGLYHSAGQTRDEEAAARLHDALAIRLLGDDAPLNFPDEPERGAR